MVRRSTPPLCICIFMPWKCRIRRNPPWARPTHWRLCAADAGHLNHMPGHIYVLCGDYEKARIASHKAIRANDMFLAYAGPFTFYTVACCHDLHLMMHTSMLLGRYGDAIGAASKMCDLLTKQVLSEQGRPKFAMSLEGYYSTKSHVWVRFGRWQDIISAPMPDEPDYTSSQPPCSTTPRAWLTPRSKTSGQLRSSASFSRKSPRIPRSRRFFNNMAHDVLAVGEKMLDGELAVPPWQPRGGL